MRSQRIRIFQGGGLATQALGNINGSLQSSFLKEKKCEQGCNVKIYLFFDHIGFSSVDIQTSREPYELSRFTLNFAFSETDLDHSIDAKSTRLAHTTTVS